MSLFLGSTDSATGTPTLHFDSFRFIRVSPFSRANSHVRLQAGAHTIDVHCDRLLENALRVTVSGVRPDGLVVEIIGAMKCDRPIFDNSDSTCDGATCKDIGDKFTIQLSIPGEPVQMRQICTGAAASSDKRTATRPGDRSMPQVTALTVEGTQEFGASTLCVKSMLSSPSGVAALVAEGISVVRMVSRDNRCVFALLAWFIGDRDDLVRDESGTYTFSTQARFDSLLLLRDASADILPDGPFPIDQQRILRAIVDLHAECMHDCAALLMQFLDMQHLASLFIDDSYNNIEEYADFHGTLGILVGMTRKIGASALGNAGIAALEATSTNCIDIPEPDYDSSDDSDSSDVPPGLLPAESHVQAVSGDESDNLAGDSEGRNKRKLRKRNWGPRSKRSLKIEKDDGTESE